MQEHEVTSGDDESQEGRHSHHHRHHDAHDETGLQFPTAVRLDRNDMPGTASHSHPHLLDTALEEQCTALHLNCVILPPTVMPAARIQVQMIRFG